MHQINDKTIIMIHFNMYFAKGMLIHGLLIALSQIPSKYNSTHKHWSQESNILGLHSFQIISD